MNTYEHLSGAERRSIERGIHAGLSMRTIAKRLGRSPNTVSEELRRNPVAGTYTARKAIQKARVRRKRSKIQCLKVATDTNLKAYVTRHVAEEQSPESISARLKNVDTELPYASTKAIYTFVHSVHGRQIDRHLYARRVRKKSGPKRNRPVSQDGRRMIDTRPRHIEKRLQFGHFEGDFIESGGDGKGSLLVLVERKTRYPFLAYTEDRSTEHVNRLMGRMLDGVPVRSLTLDNDISFRRHEALSELLRALVFFTHPYTSQEKGTVENRNKVIRQHIPKRTDLSQIPPHEIRRVEEWLRTRFMVCLGGRTPEECWDIEMEKHGTRARTKKAASVRAITSLTECPA